MHPVLTVSCKYRGTNFLRAERGVWYRRMRGMACNFHSLPSRSRSRFFRISFFYALLLTFSTHNMMVSIIPPPPAELHNQPNSQGRLKPRFLSSQGLSSLRCQWSVDRCNHADLCQIIGPQVGLVKTPIEPFFFLKQVAFRGRLPPLNRLCTSTLSAPATTSLSSFISIFRREAAHV